MSIFKKFFKNLSSGPSDTNFDDLNVEEQDMIRGVVELSDTTVKEVMVPRIDVVPLNRTSDPKTLLPQIVECGHSRFPVYDGTIDNIVGILYAKDLLRYLLIDEDISIDELLRKPYFVPESMRLDSLLKEMKKRRVHIAIAVDEYGGVSGIICLEDIIEEIIGDIQDEYDNEREDVIAIGDNMYLCDARVNLEDLNEELGIDLPSEDFDTLGGFVFDLFGKIPVRYEKVTLGAITFVIQETDGHKIRTIKIMVQENQE
ncbi:MAG: HlyC/CorC family transporter [Spirochaetales bacterium]|nr:HlyC/CorC family transporter [Spirochaetales bacterium]